MNSSSGKIVTTRETMLVRGNEARLREEEIEEEEEVIYSRNEFIIYERQQRRSFLLFLIVCRGLREDVVGALRMEDSYNDAASLVNLIDR